MCHHTPCRSSFHLAPTSPAGFPSRHESRTDHARIVLEWQIEATNRQIDRLVYELYGLTDEEIAIVEEATAR